MTCILTLVQEVIEVAAIVVDHHESITQPITEIVLEIQDAVPRHVSYVSYYLMPMLIVVQEPLEVATTICDDIPIHVTNLVGYELEDANTVNSTPAFDLLTPIIPDADIDATGEFNGADTIVSNPVRRPRRRRGRGRMSRAAQQAEGAAEAQDDSPYAPPSPSGPNVVISRDTLNPLAPIFTPHARLVPTLAGPSFWQLAASGPVTVLPAPKRKRRRGRRLGAARFAELSEGELSGSEAAPLA